MKNYKIMSANNVDKLAEYVTTALNDGWELVGGIVVNESSFDGKNRFNQAIIKTVVDRPSMLTEAAAGHEHRSHIPH